MSTTLTRDFTPERPPYAVKLAAESGGRVAVVVDEGTPTLGTVVVTAAASIVILRSLGWEISGSEAEWDESTVYRGTWSASATYLVGDVVQGGDGLTYQCTLRHTNQTPPNIVYWNEIVMAGSGSYQPADDTLTAWAAYNTNGLVTQTAADTFTGRTITGPAAGLTVTNGNGVAGNPTLALANDLAALEGLGSTGLAVRTGTDTWTVRAVTGTTDQITVTNGDGVAGAPTLSFPSLVQFPGTAGFIMPRGDTANRPASPKNGQMRMNENMGSTTGLPEVWISDSVIDDPVGAWYQLALTVDLTGYQPLDATLTALAVFNTNGILVQTAADTFAGRTLSAPAAGLTISNPAGTAGNPTFALANDLAGLEGLASTGFAARTTTDTWEVRTLTAPAAGLTISNGAGVSGNPTFALANDLAALEGLSLTGFATRTAADTWAQRTITGPAAGLTVTNGNGVSGNPTLALANDLAALEGLGSTGFAVRTAADTWAVRTITGTTNQITVTDGAGASGNPTLSLPQDIHTAATPTWTSVTLSGGSSVQALGLTGFAYWGTTGTGAPAFTTRSAGTKLVLYDGLGGAAVDYGLGIETSNMWFSVPAYDANRGFRFYGGTTIVTEITDDGAVQIREHAGPDAPGAGYGSYWVKSDTPNTPYFTDDAGASYKLQYAYLSATQRVLGRNSASAGVSEEVTLTQLLDWIGSAAQGDILYRGAATWARLAAPTNGGKVLKTGGSSGNPSWASVFTVTAVKASGTTRTNTTTLASDPDLTFAVTSGEKYAFKFKVFFTCNANPDIQFTIDGPAVTQLRYSVTTTAGGVATAANRPVQTAFTSALSLVSASNGSGEITIEGYVQPSASGTVALQWAQNTLDAVNGVTVDAGSWLEVAVLS